MVISAIEITIPLAQAVEVSADTLSVDLSDGRTISVPLGWFPRLSHATRKERGEWQLIGRGQGIHWPLIDEDISVEGLLAGRPSGESQTSFAKWLATRGTHKHKNEAKLTFGVKPLKRKAHSKSRRKVGR